MTLNFYILVLFGVAALSYFAAIGRIRSAIRETGIKQHSLDSFHGLYMVIWFLVPPLLLILLWQFAAGYFTTALLESRIALQPGQTQADRDILMAQIMAVQQGVIPLEQASEPVRQAAAYLTRLRQNADYTLMALAALLAAFGFAHARRHLVPRFRARQQVEKFCQWLMICASAIAIFITIGIVLSLVFEAIRFFQKIPLLDFLFGLQWSPQIAIREGQAGGSGAFGAIPLFAGTFLITLIAMLLAVPVGLMTAIYLSEYAPRKLRDIFKPAIEILAGIPTVVYGFFAALLVAPFLRDSGAYFGLTLSSESALAAGLVMGIMVIPIISSLSDDVINAVPQTLRDGAFALGATKSESIRQVVLPAALPGVISAILLAISRAIGETMIVVMAAGVAANLTANPFASVTTVTVQIVTLLVGDQEFDSAKTLAAFALGLVLFFVTLALNILALHIVRKYREQYE